MWVLRREERRRDWEERRGEEGRETGRRRWLCFQRYFHGIYTMYIYIYACTYGQEYVVTVETICTTGGYLDIVLSTWKHLLSSVFCLPIEHPSQNQTKLRIRIENEKPSGLRAKVRLLYHVCYTVGS